MKYTVTWSQSAEDELAQIWFATSVRAKVTEAVAVIDRQLRDEPDSLSESREADRRVTIVPPLTVTFQVSVEDRLVRVLRVRDFVSKSADDE